jgi:branched-chain amino acid aminotransferase
MNYICANGIILPASDPVLHYDNPGFKYGDGLFETIKVIKGQIPLAEYHFKRLFHGMAVLHLSNEALRQNSLTSFIFDLCSANKCLDLSRVRLQVYRNNQGAANFLIEAIALEPGTNRWHLNGFTIDIFPAARKSIDIYSNLKSSNFLPYVMAGLYARENMLDDAIVLNANGRIADSTKANIFLLRDEFYYTPAIEEGCVQGVMRSYLLDHLKGKVIQTAITLDDLLSAEEVFLTNAVFGIRAVKKFRSQIYSNTSSHKLYSQFITTLFG